MAENRSNIAWYLPKACTAKLLAIYTQFEQKAVSDAKAQTGPTAHGRPAPQGRALETGSS